ncbi:MAG TPA: YfjI family protein, partial [Waddliaceae bacterium]
IENLRNLYLDSKITILADDDKESKNNKGELVNSGKNAAEQASKQYGCGFILPEFPDGFRLPNGECPTDFNDLHVDFGLAEVKRQVVEACKTFDCKEQLEQNNVSVCDWLEPKPIKASLYPVPPFDSKTLLPEALHDWIMDEANRMPCPPDFVASAVLVSLGTVIGARCAIKPKSFDNWQIVPNVWGGCVGIPASKKSPATTSGMKPLNRLIARAAKDHQNAVGAYEVAKLVFDAKKESIESNIKTAAKKSNKSEIDKFSKELHTHRQEDQKPPTLRRYKSNDTTIEKLGELLKENPAGLLILRDELVGLLASWDKAGHEGDRTFFLEAWNGNDNFDTDRITRGSIFIPNLCVSIFGGIQPDKLTRYLEQAANALENDGMLQRFQVLVYPDDHEWEWRDNFPDKDAFEKAYSIFNQLDDFNPVEWGATPADDYDKFPYFQFNGQGQEIFIEWTTDLHKVKLKSEDNPLMSQHLAKFDKLFPALSLIFHLVDCASTGRRGSISPESAWRAAAWCEYLEAHARRCYGLLADDGLRSAQALADKLCKDKLLDGFTARDIRRNQWRYLTTDSAVQAGLDWLEDEGWLRANEVGGLGPGTGRRTYRYSINPKIKKIEQYSGDEHSELA